MPKATTNIFAIPGGKNLVAPGTSMQTLKQLVAQRNSQISPMTPTVTQGQSVALQKNGTEMYLKTASEPIFGAEPPGNEIFPARSADPQVVENAARKLAAVLPSGVFSETESDENTVKHAFIAGPIIQAGARALPAVGRFASKIVSRSAPLAGAAPAAAPAATGAAGIAARLGAKPAARWAGQTAWGGATAAAPQTASTATGLLGRLGANPTVQTAGRTAWKGLQGAALGEGLDIGTQVLTGKQDPGFAGMGLAAGLAVVPGGKLLRRFAPGALSAVRGSRLFQAAAPVARSNANRIMAGGAILGTGGAIQEANTGYNMLSNPIHSMNTAREATAEQIARQFGFGSRQEMEQALIPIVQSLRESGQLAGAESVPAQQPAAPPSTALSRISDYVRS